MAATSKTWLKYYSKGLREPGDFFEIGQQPLSFFDSISDSYFEDERGFLNQVGSHPSNFVILPGPLRTVRMVSSQHLYHQQRREGRSQGDCDSRD
jgi:hypothetical protein